MGRTREVFRKIGLSDVPMTFDQRHTDYAVNGTKADHQMSMEMIERPPEPLENPIAIIGSGNEETTTAWSPSSLSDNQLKTGRRPCHNPRKTSKSNDVQIDA